MSDLSNDVKALTLQDNADETQKTLSSSCETHFHPELVDKYIQRLKKEYGDIYEKINTDIDHYYISNLQAQTTLEWKDEARVKLERAGRKAIPSLKLFTIGSTMNGCGTYTSDLNLCASISQADFKHGGNTIPSVLNILRKALQKNVKEANITHVDDGSDPFLYIPMSEEYSDLEVLIKVNNLEDIYRTHLIHHYSLLDERFPALCLLVKLWATQTNIGWPQEDALNSISLVYMVIHYLQCGLKHPILPNLQESNPDIFSNERPIKEMRFFKKVYNTKSKNTDQYADLLIGFLTYYRNFEFKKYAISIRSAKVFSRLTLSADVNKYYPIYIEDPYTFDNSARNVTIKGCKRIKNKFIKAHEMWIKDENPSLEKMGIQFESRTLRYLGHFVMDTSL